MSATPTMTELQLEWEPVPEELGGFEDNGLLYRGPGGLVAGVRGLEFGEVRGPCPLRVEAGVGLAGSRMSIRDGLAVEGPDGTLRLRQRSGLGLTKAQRAFDVRDPDGQDVFHVRAEKGGRVAFCLPSGERLAELGSHGELTIVSSPPPLLVALVVLAVTLGLDGDVRGSGLLPILPF